MGLLGRLVRPKNKTTAPGQKFARLGLHIFINPLRAH